MSFIFIAHRSGPGIYPEQTIVSARHSLSIGADMVEMDVQYTKDGIPVICHDPNTLRMFGIDSLVRDMMYSEFMMLRHASDPAYPSHSLDDVIRSGVSPVLFHCKFTGELLKDLAKRLDSARNGHWVIGVQRQRMWISLRIILVVSRCFRSWSLNLCFRISLKERLIISVYGKSGLHRRR